MPPTAAAAGPFVSRIGFGSCHNQHKEPRYEVFHQLEHQPRPFDLFVWLGDVVYNKGGTVGTLREAYGNVSHANSSYSSFAAKLPFGVVGTWDDHDFGINDGGGLLTPALEERADLFWEFIGGAAKARPVEGGVYSAHVFPGKHAGQSVKVILMDTRYARSPYVWSALGSVGEEGQRWYGKLFPVLAAGVRSAAQLVGLPRVLALNGISNHRMLSDEQWQWLERELVSSSSQVTLLVSSIQVFTTNPSVESWSQFPLEQHRLVALLNRVRPSGLLVLSGDVHVGQLVYEDIEVTSSGLTHTCTAGGIPQFVCSLTFGLFDTRRRRQQGEPSLLYDRNVGSVDIDWDAQTFEATVQSLSNGGGDGGRLQVKRTFGANWRHLSVVPMRAEVRFGVLFLGLAVVVFLLVRLGLWRRRRVVLL